MVNKTVKKSKVEKSEATNEVQEAAVCAEGGGKGCEGACAEVACCDPDAEGSISAAGMARVGRQVAKKGKRYHGERLKLLVEVCEKWCLF